MHALDYASLAGKDIRRQPVRSLLTIVALAISTVIFVTLLSISLGAKTAIVQGLGLSSSLQSILVTPNQNVTPSFLGGSVQIANDKATTIDDAAVRDVAAIPHVASADPTVSVWELKNFTVAGYDKTFVAAATGITLSHPAPAKLSAGTFFASDRDAHQVVLGWSYAKQMGYTSDTVGQLVGKTITFTTQPAYRGAGAAIPAPRSSRQQLEAFAAQTTSLTATIAGVSAQGSSDNQVLLPMSWARKIKSVATYTSQGVLETADPIAKNGYNAIAVQADSTQAVASITGAVASKGYGFTSTQQQIDRINSLTTIMWGLFGSIAIISLITACLGIANTMLTTISEQKYAIGVWRAYGARRRTIALRFIVQAGILGAIGGTVGAAAGWGMSRYISGYVARLLQEQHLPALDIVHVSPIFVAGSVVLAIVLGALSGLYPAWRAARQDPSVALSAGQ